MVDRLIAQSFEQIDQRAQDAMHGYESGFMPQRSDVAIVGKQPAIAQLDPLSTVIPANAYYLGASDAHGYLYTRDGSLTVSDDGSLTTRSGIPVLGFAGRSSNGTPQPLRVDPIDMALHRARDVRVDVNGVVSYTAVAIDPRTATAHTHHIIVGRLALARFPAGSVPQRIDGQRAIAPLGIAPHIGSPGDGAFEVLQTYARDVGNVDPIASVEKIQEAYLHFEAVAEVRRAQKQLQSTATELVK